MSTLRLLEQNKAMIVGRVTRDPELRFTPSNQAVTSFNIASNRSYRDNQTGNWKEVASFIPIVAWGKQAERCGEKLKKGSAVFVEGRLQSKSWETKTGDKRYALEVIADRIQILTKSEAENAVSENGSSNNTINEPVNNVADNSNVSEDHEEIPF